MDGKYKISGMTCDGCIKAVTGAIKAVLPTAEVVVDLDSGEVVVTGTADGDVIARAVNDAGFTFEGTVG